MAIEIHEVTNHKELKKFVKFPFDLYKNNPYWVPPLIKNEMDTLRNDKNPVFEYCEAKYWIAYSNSGKGHNKKILGRIAGIVNKKYMERWKKNYANIGWFDYINDINVSKKLVEIVETWAKNKKCKGITGPLGFTNFEHQGVLIKGFDEYPTIASQYNYEYYQEHMDALGFKKEVDYLEFQAPIPDKIPEKADRISRLILKKRNLQLLKASSKKDLLRYAEKIFKTINKSFGNIYSSVLFNEKQMKWYSKKYFPFLMPEYVKIIIDKNDDVAGFIIAMPSMSKAFQNANGHVFPFGFLHILKALKKPELLDLYIAAILPQYQNKGLNAVFMTELNKSALKKNISAFETNSELEENKKVIAHWKYYNARQHKRKRCYIKEI
ncbi:MAG: hypothetical protein ACOC5F_01580 [Candidatus Aminicenantaceae bacterium]